MTKSYIFSSSGFSANEHGGIFYKGKRKFRFECSSVSLISQIEKLEKTHDPFPLGELPDKVVALLVREGLLREHQQNQSPWSRLQIKLIDSTNAAKAQVCRRLPPHLRELSGLLGMQLLGFWAAVRTHRSIVLLPRPVVRILIRPLAFLFRPMTMLTAIVLQAAWLVLNWPAPAAFLEHYSMLDGFSKTAVLSLVFFSILFHELCHAAAGYQRAGSSGEVRIGLMACMPYCFTTVPDFHTLASLGRLCVLSAGVVGQIALAIIALMLAPRDGLVHLAAQTSIIVALCNLAPIPGLDGAGILRELRGRVPTG